MINAIITGLMNIIMSLVDVLLSPIDLLISQFLPDLANAISAVGAMFNLVGQYIGFAVSLTGLSSATLSLIVAYFTFKLTVPVLVYTIKLAIKWYNALKL